ncbi:MAG: FAD-dependent oxidoreductase [Desulfosoma sp.]
MNHPHGWNIAVIGAGISGIAAAYVLQRAHRVTIFERNESLGGHTRTVVVDDGSDAGLPVDTGFIVLNDRTYPLLLAYFDQLGVRLRKTDMAFSYWNPTRNFFYAGTGWRGLLAQPKNMANPKFLRLLLGIGRFMATTRRSLMEGSLRGISLGDYLDRQRFSKEVVHAFVLPMAGAIWSTPARAVAAFPAEAFARFYEHHGLLSLRRRPQWFFVHGGSHSYIKAFLKRFQGEVLTQKAVARVFRHEDGVEVLCEDGDRRRFDAVVFAAHADQTLAMIENPDPRERALLSAWRYNRNRTVLHTDPSYLPPKSAAWASWNFVERPGSDSDRRLTVTYFMNRLQALPSATPYCVTLNPWADHPPRGVIAAFEDTHPMYTFESMDTQNALPSLNGRHRSYFCGAYFGYGFHEDGIRSALQVTRNFGLDL